jgi:hypothetical protein
MMVHHVKLVALRFETATGRERREGWKKEKGGVVGGFILARSSKARLDLPPFVGIEAG